MSRRKPLTCQSNKVCIVIRKNKEISKDLIKQYCLENFEKFAFIEHKNDVDTSGVIIPVHYHIVGNMKGTKTPFSVRLNTLVKFFRFDNSNGIEIDQYNSLESSIQYLTHKNQKEKTLHQVDEIVHNFEQSEFDILYTADSGNVITYDLLFNACLQSNNIMEVIKLIGIGNYRVYRSVIWDIWNCINNKQDCIKQ